jgi:hypothetical protein
MYKVFINNGTDTWVAKTHRTYRAAVRTAEKIRRNMYSAVVVWIEKAKK